MAIQDRPRRKKKKHDEGNGRLIVLLSVGGLFAIGGITLLIVLLTRPSNPNKQLAQGTTTTTTTTTTGDPKFKGPAKKTDPEEPAKDIGTKRRPDNFKLRLNRIERLNELRNIGQFYAAYAAEHAGRPPGTVAGFLKYIERDAPPIHKAIQDKYYLVLPNVKSGIVAYEYDPDQLGRHGTTDVSAVVEEISSEELLKKLKEQRN